MPNVTLLTIINPSHPRLVQSAPEWLVLKRPMTVWFGAVIRGDCEAIRIGKRTNIQNLCVLHADPGYPCTLGDGVTVGHGAIVHGATLEDDVLIGMKAVIMNGAKIGRGSIVAVGAIVTEGVEIPIGSIVMGQPAKVKRPAEERHLVLIRHAAEHYVQAAKAYRSPLTP